MGDDKNIRHRFTVPVGDTSVTNWIDAQSNLGFSLRILIKSFIRDYGIQDVTCLELGMPVNRVGRPPKKAEIHLNGFKTQDQPEESFPDSHVGQGLQGITDINHPVQAQESITRPVVHQTFLTEEQKKSQEALSEGRQIDMNNLGL